MDAPPSQPPDSIDRRSKSRLEVEWSVDCTTEDTFLYAAITNISEMGIFVHTVNPLPLGTRMTLRFAASSRAEEGPTDAPEQDEFVLRGKVQWINPVRENHDNPNPGMGIQFVDLDPEDRERLVEVIHTIAYVR